MKLYRAVSPAELADIRATGDLRPGPPSFQGKWFAESPQRAAQWGRQLYQLTGIPFHLVQVEVPQQVADRLFRIANLDRIGPARFADIPDLADINQNRIGPIVELVAIPRTPP